MNKFHNNYLLLLFSLFIIQLLFRCDINSIPEIGKDDAIYGFEEDEMGWFASPFDPAIIAVHQTNTISYLGSGSLMLDVDLIGKTKNQGATFIDMQKSPLKGVAVPLNLHGTKISGWVYASKGLSGAQYNENYIRLYVTDSKYKFAYGVEKPIIENEWFKIDVIPDTIEHAGEYIWSDFDPTSIIYIGVYIHMNWRVESDSTYHFSNCIYLDSIDW